MEETHEQHKLHGFMQCLIYLSIALEADIFVYKVAPFWGFFYGPVEKLSHVFIYQHLVYSKFATLFLICLVSIGTLAKKKQELDPKKHIQYPLTLGLFLFFGSIFLYGRQSGVAFAFTSWCNLAYMLSSLLGAIMLSV